MHIHDDPNDIEYSTAMRLQTREITDEQTHRFEGYTSEIFAAFGLDLNTPASIDTPRHFIKALFARTFTDVYRDSELIMHILVEATSSNPNTTLQVYVTSIKYIDWHIA